MESIRRRREAIFGHMARMSPNIPAHQALRLQVEASVGRRPDRDWVRSSGHPRNRWIDQLRQDHQRPPADLWRAAIRRGHTGATLRSSTTTWWRRPVITGMWVALQRLLWSSFILVDTMQPTPYACCGPSRTPDSSGRWLHTMVHHSDHTSPQPTKQIMASSWIRPARSACL